MTFTWKPRKDARWGEESLYAGTVRVASYTKSLNRAKPEMGHMALFLPGFANSQASMPFEWGGGLPSAKASAEEAVRRWFARAME